MIEDGLFDVFRSRGLRHALIPGIPIGSFAVRPGLIMAPGTFEIRVTGRGAHAAMPHQGIDPWLSARTSSWRWNRQPQYRPQQRGRRDSIPCGRCVQHPGNRFAERAVLIRSFGDLLDGLEQLQGVAATYGASVDNYMKGYPATVNALTKRISLDVAGRRGSGPRGSPSRSGDGGEFSYMLEEKPGCYIWIGNGDTAGLHHPEGC